MAAHSRGIATAIAAALSAVVALAGCAVTTANRAPDPPAATSSPANGTDDSGMYDSKGFLIRRVDPTEDPTRKRYSTLHQEELASLRGLTIEQARQRLKDLGHTGTVHVGAFGHEATGCATGRVCQTYPHDGVASNGEITLYLKKAFEAPPLPPPP